MGLEIFLFSSILHFASMLSQQVYRLLTVFDLLPVYLFVDCLRKEGV